MKTSDVLKPKTKEEIIEILKKLLLDPDLIIIIIGNDLAYKFVVSYISKNDNKKPEEIVTELNGLAEIIRLMPRK